MRSALCRTVRCASLLVGALALEAAVLAGAQATRSALGVERAVDRHLAGDEEFRLTLTELVAHGRKLFEANWTEADGVGRPLTKGTGAPLSDPRQPLRGPRSFNRISGPDANSCQGCHSAPYGISGGSGDIVTVSFEGAGRFDFVTFDREDVQRTRGAVDETGRPVMLQTVGNVRATPGLFGAGYVEMLARQMTGDLQRIRDRLSAGQAGELVSKGVSFGTLRRDSHGRWDVSDVRGLPAQALVVSTRGKPSLVIQPWHQSGTSVSLREITNDSYNLHLGIQTTERFGVGTDQDGDGVTNEMTRGDVTAVTAFEATLAVPGRVIPDDPLVERAVFAGERLFTQLQCAACHVPALPLSRTGWTYTEPNPFNPIGNLRPGQAETLRINLSDAILPTPRLVPSSDDPATIEVPAYTDLKLHDITDHSDSSAAEPLDLNQPASSASFYGGNRRFLTKRLWAVGNQPPYFHHGLFTTLREAVRAHAGEALEQRRAFQALPAPDQDAVIAFLGTLQVLPPGTKSRVVDEHYRPRTWPPAASSQTTRSPFD